MCNFMCNTKNNQSNQSQIDTLIEEERIAEERIAEAIAKRRQQREAQRIEAEKTI